ncbi:MAG: DUF3267 domain-containing protein [Clostridiales bacterium]|nr:DUF3267 domain-containing protein [Clostridiales bacterium]
MRIEVENDAIRARKKQEYEDLVSEMDKKGMEARLEKISVLKANLYALLLLLIAGFIAYPIYVLVHGSDSISADNLFGFSGPSGVLFFAVVYVVTIFIHEFIHGFFWHFACEKKWGSIDFGFNPKNITPYCHCCEALTVSRYFWGCIAPTLFLGVLPIIVGIVIRYVFLVTIGVIGIIGGAGDLMVIWTLRKHRDCMLFDHPYEVGYAYFVKKNEG